MFKSIFTVEDNIDGDDTFICFCGVKFLKDFGPFKIGEEIEALNVDFEEATFQEEDIDGNNKERKCGFRLEPCEIVG